MARQRLLSEAVQARLLGFPADVREMIRYATLGSEDFALIAQRRGEANQLGFGLMLVCLHHPGRVLDGHEVPPPALLNYLARDSSTWNPTHSPPTPGATRPGGPTSPN
jgi:hypothetical protein